MLPVELTERVATESTIASAGEMIIATAACDCQLPTVRVAGDRVGLRNSAGFGLVKFVIADGSADTINGGKRQEVNCKTDELILEWSGTQWEFANDAITQQEMKKLVVNLVKLTLDQIRSVHDQYKPLLAACANNSSTITTIRNAAKAIVVTDPPSDTQAFNALRNILRAKGGA